jgi:hypothetical protein
MMITGTSTLHDWTSHITELTWAGSILTEGDQVKSIRDMSLTIPVKMIKSEKGGIMDDKTYEAFRSDQHPNIIFKLGSATPVDGGVNAFGTLTMAGSQRSIEMRPEAKVMPDGSVQIKGSQRINMEDYKMTPPQVLLGAIKVHPEVTFIYDILLIP